MPMQDRAGVNIANSIRMKRSQSPSVTCLIVEGRDDKAFFGRYTEPHVCHITVASGRPRVVEAILELDRTQFQGALGIVDADFTVLDEQPPASPNLVVTDKHDVECMLLASPALEHVLREQADETKLTSVQETRGTVAKYLLTLGAPVGYLRWASARKQWSLKFEGLDFSTFVREKDFDFDQARFFEKVRNHQGGRTAPLPSVEEMQSEVDALANPGHDLWHVCCGHDLIELLSIGLRKVLGERQAAHVKREALEQQLRLAYEEGYFQSTVLYVAIVAWERRNPPFKVLRAAAGRPGASMEGVDVG
jgi:hypothetical protein